MKKYIRYICFLVFISLIVIALNFKSFNIGLGAILLLFVNNIIYSLENLKERIVFCVFNCMIFVFILSRPTIQMFRAEKWWEVYSQKQAIFALTIVGSSLLFLFLGGKIGEIIGKQKPNEKKINVKYRNDFLKNLSTISLILFYVSFGFNLIVGFEKVIFMIGKEYTEYYVSFQSNLPYIVYICSTFMTYSLCIYLGGKPTKKEAIIPLGLYFLSAVPDLIIGMRNPIMLHALFIVIYFYMRNDVEKKEIWLGKIEGIILGIGMVFILPFMGIYRYLISGVTYIKYSVFSGLVDFFYGQGVTFDVLQIGYACIPKLPDREFRNYTFGGFIDYFLHGTIAQKFFGAVPLGNGNNLNNALLSNRFAHNMSYIDKGEKYLNGEGWGSSYLLEVFTDYGYIGIIIFSLILGALMVSYLRIMKKNSLTAAIVLITLTQIFFMPRSGATECLEFLLQIQFWATVIICYLGAGLCTKKYEIDIVN